MIKQLLDAGVSLRHTRKAIECLRASGDGVASASLVIADDRSVMAHSGEELFDLLRGGQGVLSIVLGMERIVSEVDAAITELREARPEGHPAAVPAEAAPTNGSGARPSSTRRRSRLLADTSAALRRSPLDQWHRDHGARHGPLWGLGNAAGVRARHARRAHGLP